MVSPHLSLSPELFTKAFPFHFVFNRQREILQAGAVLERISGAQIIGSKFEQYFQINRPNVVVDFDAIQKKSHALFMLEFIQNGMQLKGQMMYQPEEELIFFLGSPWITDTANLVPLNIKLKDFAIHDPIVDFLFLLQAKNSALADAEKLTAELTKQRAELQRALAIQENLAKVAEEQAQKLQQSLRDLRHAQAQLIQAEKMSSLGQLVAGIAHEINNPVNFIYANIDYVEQYTQDLFKLLNLYKTFNYHIVPKIQEYIRKNELDFIFEDLPKTINSMKIGAERIRDIVLSLRNFSRLDEAEVERDDLREGIDSTLLILQNRFKTKGDKSGIEIIKNYGNLPLVECYPGQLNQVFMNIISNAIDAFDSNNIKNSSIETRSRLKRITITTEALKTNYVAIRIADNGPGMTEAVKAKLFDPFFTTKPVGKGTGLGLSISYQIVVEKHGGKLTCISEPGRGSEFCIEIPISVNRQTEDDISSLSCVM
ncbi:MAG: ATP-binding protein [Fischerella sp.]|nr:ATP-binding protein [Fischerella sp.]